MMLSKVESFLCVSQAGRRARKVKSLSAVK